MLCNVKCGLEKAAFDSEFEDYEVEFGKGVAVI